MKKVIRATVIVLGYFRVVMGLEYFWYRFSLDSYLFWGTEIIILVLPSRSDAREQLRSPRPPFSKASSGFGRSGQCVSQAASYD
jgi:hypothetical protein